jgi:hypothetical protein
MQRAKAGYRVNTGPLQLDDDWPGYFMRGDDTIAGLLRYAATLITDEPIANRLIHEANKMEESWIRGNGSKED